MIDPHGAVVSSHLPLARGWGALRPMSDFRTNMGAWWGQEGQVDSKSSVEVFFKVSSNVKADFLRLIDCRDQTRQLLAHATKELLKG